MNSLIKKFLAATVCVALLLCVFPLSSCKKSEDNNKIKVLCTVFPIYDWAKNVIGDSNAIELSLLVKNGSDIHSFSPSFEDMAEIKNSDLVVLVGGASDAWVKDSVEKDSSFIALTEAEEMTVYEVSSDSFAAAHTHENGEECHETHDHGSGFDEHIWLSLNNAIAACKEIRDALCELDKDNAQAYKDNTSAYIENLSSLNERLHVVSESIREPLIFADRFPFVYMLEDHDIDYYAAFEGCTAEADADFDTTIRLAKKIDEFSSKFVFVTESPIDPKLADTVISQSTSPSAQIVSLNSMQSVTKDDINRGATYSSIYEKNLSVLEEIFLNTGD